MFTYIKNLRRKSQTKISDKNLRRKFQTKIPDANFGRKSQTIFKCVIRDKDNFVTKQHMLGVKKIKQLKRIIRDKADFATKQRMLGGQDFRPKLKFSCSVASLLQRFVVPCNGEM